MPNDVFAQLKSNVGGFLSMSTFLSTSESENVARIYAGGDEERTTVLMIILMDPAIRSKVPVGNIDCLSQYGGAECEYLFSMGSVFRIVSVDQKEDDLWEAVLKLTVDRDPQMLEFSDFVRVQIQNSDNPLVTLGNLTNRIHETNGERFYIKALENETDWRERAKILDILGDFYKNMDQYDRALESYQQAFDIKRENEPENKQLLSESFFYLGNIYHLKENFNTALDYLQRSLEIEVSTTTESIQESIAERNYNIALIFYFQQKYEESLIYFNRALNIRLKIHPKRHNDISATYYIIGHTFHKLGRIQEAFEYAEKAVANSFFTGDRESRQSYEKALEKVYEQLDSQAFWPYIGTLNLYDAGDGMFLTWA
ncbi:unnamed protein product [Rotaria sp. Silwood2]|nr:unnamed protein product [Rotaria sp. Silwood2]